MAKGLNARANVKKAPKMSKDEKRAAKRAKRAQ
jgi:hypothetical protein